MFNVARVTLISALALFLSSGAAYPFVTPSSADGLVLSSSPTIPPDPWELRSSPTIPPDPWELRSSPTIPPDPWELRSSPTIPPDPWELQ